jgi:hypothetical protein
MNPEYRFEPCQHAVSGVFSAERTRTCLKLTQVIVVGEIKRPGNSRLRDDHWVIPVVWAPQAPHDPGCLRPARSQPLAPTTLGTDHGQYHRLNGVELGQLVYPHR